MPDISITTPADNSQFTTQQTVILEGLYGPVGTVTIDPTGPDSEIVNGIAGMWTVTVEPFGAPGTYNIEVVGPGDNNTASINVIIVSP